jgi:hypothetical protein
MNTTRAERVRAEQVSAILDQRDRDPQVEREKLDPQDAGLLDTARQLARLPDLLGPVEPRFQEQVLRAAKAQRPRPEKSRPFRLAWVAAGLAVILLVAVALTPLGQTAVASFLAVFNLGSTEVRIESAGTPSPLPATAVAAESAIRESLTLEQAQEQIAFALPQPAYLPSAYQLAAVYSYTYPDLPAWVPQPFFLEFVYTDARQNELILRIYPIMLGEQATIAGLDLKATSIQRVENIEVSDQPAVLLQLGNDRAGIAWREVVWEHDDLILALSALHLSEADLLRVARSVH